MCVGGDKVCTWTLSLGVEAVFTEHFYCSGTPALLPVPHQPKAMSLDHVLVLNSSFHPSFCVWSIVPTSIVHHASPGATLLGFHIASSGNKRLLVKISYAHCQDQYALRTLVYPVFPCLLAEGENPQSLSPPYAETADSGLTLN